MNIFEYAAARASGQYAKSFNYSMGDPGTQNEKTAVVCQIMQDKLGKAVDIVRDAGLFGYAGQTEWLQEMKELLAALPADAWPNLDDYAIDDGQVVRATGDNAGHTFIHYYTTPDMSIRLGYAAYYDDAHTVVREALLSFADEDAIVIVAEENGEWVDKGIGDS